MPLIISVIILALIFVLFASSVGNSAVELAQAQAQIETAHAAQAASASAIVSSGVVVFLVIVVLILVAIVVAASLSRPHSRTHYDQDDSRPITRAELMQILADSQRGMITGHAQNYLPDPDENYYARQPQSKMQRRLEYIERLERL